MTTDLPVLPIAPKLPPAEVLKLTVREVREGDLHDRADAVAVEEPLEIRLGCDRAGKRVQVPVSVTMRTPGHDADLAVGFLLTEAIIHRRDDIADVRQRESDNVICIDLSRGVAVDLQRLERHFYTSSSCGVCGKASIRAVHVESSVRVSKGEPVIGCRVIHRLPATLRTRQSVFDQTGGLHAAALFNADGQLMVVREDVGRHNALDKLIGAQLLASAVPMSENIVLVSGRASFELVQKAAVAGIPIMAAVGAPSSLAVGLAREHGLTLVGFVRHDRFNVYSGAERILGPGVPD